MPIGPPRSNHIKFLNLFAPSEHRGKNYTSRVTHSYTGQSQNKPSYEYWRPNRGVNTETVTASAGAGVAQSVQCLATDWTTGVLSPTEANSPSSLCVQISSGAHPASYSMGTGGKARPGRDANHSPHLVRKSRQSRSCTSSPPSSCMTVAGQLLQLKDVDI
jgi:hypothetical protein